ncbi:MAG: thiamine phosphate synthase, partial [Gammaproteobacteria bacterium]|nr:thiamine phosphate synthase [Gammaproteobacteria bacterium]
MVASELPHGLYAVTDSRLIPADELTTRVAQAIAGGAAVIQYREKLKARDVRQQEAAALQALCRERGVPLIINDDIELAARVGAAGVHLGREDASIAQARERLGPHALVGVSCYNRIERALKAAAAGTSYVAFGRFFPSATKPGAKQAETILLEQARALLDLPVVAIGGITPENAACLIAAGA